MVSLVEQKMGVSGAVHNVHIELYESKNMAHSRSKNETTEVAKKSWEFLARSFISYEFLTFPFKDSNFAYPTFSHAFFSIPIDDSTPEDFARAFITNPIKSSFFHKHTQQKNAEFWLCMPVHVNQ